MSLNDGAYHGQAEPISAFLQSVGLTAPSERFEGRRGDVGVEPGSFVSHPQEHTIILHAQLDLDSLASILAVRNFVRWQRFPKKIF